MSQSNKFYLIIIAIFITLVGLFIFIQEPFRDDTEDYLAIKRDSWSQLQSAGSSDDLVRTSLIDLNGELENVKCNKVDDVYRSECDTLKDKVSQATDLINSGDDGNRGSQLGTEIANILKN